MRPFLVSLTVLFAKKTMVVLRVFFFFFTSLQVITRGITSITLSITRITGGVTSYKYYKYNPRYYVTFQGITVIITAAAYGYYKD